MANELNTDLVLTGKADFTAARKQASDFIRDLQHQVDRLSGSKFVDPNKLRSFNDVISQIKQNFKSIETGKLDTLHGSALTARLGKVVKQINDVNRALNTMGASIRNVAAEEARLAGRRPTSTYNVSVNKLAQLLGIPAGMRYSDQVNQSEVKRLVGLFLGPRGGRAYMDNPVLFAGSQGAVLRRGIETILAAQRAGVRRININVERDQQNALTYLLRSLGISAGVGTTAPARSAMLALPPPSSSNRPPIIQMGTTVPQGPVAARALNAYLNAARMGAGDARFIPFGMFPPKPQLLLPPPSTRTLPPIIYLPDRSAPPPRTPAQRAMASFSSLIASGVNPRDYLPAGYGLPRDEGLFRTILRRNFGTFVRVRPSTSQMPDQPWFGMGPRWENWMDTLRYRTFPALRQVGRFISGQRTFEDVFQGPKILPFAGGDQQQRTQLFRQLKWQYERAMFAFARMEENPTQGNVQNYQMQKMLAKGMRAQFVNAMAAAANFPEATKADPATGKALYPLLNRWFRRSIAVDYAKFPDDQPYRTGRNRLGIPPEGLFGIRWFGGGNFPYWNNPRTGLDPGGRTRGPYGPPASYQMGGGFGGGGGYGGGFGGGRRGGGGFLEEYPGGPAGRGRSGRRYMGDLPGFQLARGADPTAAAREFGGQFNYFLGRTLQILSIRAVLHTMRDIVRESVRFQASMEQIRLGFAETLSLQNRLYTNLEQEIDVRTQIAASYNGANKALDRLYKTSIDFGIPMQEIAEAFAVVGGAIRSANIGIDQSTKLISLLVVVAERIQIPFNVLARDVRDIFTGLNVQRTILGNLLGLTQGQVMEWIRLGTLGKELEDRLKIVEDTIQDNLDTFNGLVNSVRTLVQLIGTIVGQPFFTGLKDVLKDIRAFFMTFKESPKELQQVTERMAEMVRYIKDLVRESTKFLTILLQIVKAYVAFKVAREFVVPALSVGALGLSGVARGGAGVARGASRIIEEVGLMQAQRAYLRAAYGIPPREKGYLGMISSNIGTTPRGIASAAMAASSSEASMVGIIGGATGVAALTPTVASSIEKKLAGGVVATGIGKMLTKATGVLSTIAAFLAGPWGAVASVLLAFIAFFKGEEIISTIYGWGKRLWGGFEDEAKAKAEEIGRMMAKGWSESVRSPEGLGQREVLTYGPQREAIGEETYIGGALGTRTLSPEAKATLGLLPQDLLENALAQGLGPNWREQIKRLQEVEQGANEFMNVVMAARSGEAGPMGAGETGVALKTPFSMDEYVRAAIRMTSPNATGERLEGLVVDWMRRLQSPATSQEDILNMLDMRRFANTPEKRAAFFSMLSGVPQEQLGQQFSVIAPGQAFDYKTGAAPPYAVLPPGVTPNVDYSGQTRSGQVTLREMIAAYRLGEERYPETTSAIKELKTFIEVMRKIRAMPAEAAKDLVQQYDVLDKATGEKTTAYKPTIDVPGYGMMTPNDITNRAVELSGKIRAAMGRGDVAVLDARKWLEAAEEAQEAFNSWIYNAWTKNSEVIDTMEEVAVRNRRDELTLQERAFDAQAKVLGRGGGDYSAAFAALSTQFEKVQSARRGLEEETIKKELESIINQLNLLPSLRRRAEGLRQERIDLMLRQFAQESSEKIMGLFQSLLQNMGEEAKLALRDIERRGQIKQQIGRRLEIGAEEDFKDVNDLSRQGLTQSGRVRFLRPVFRAQLGQQQENITTAQETIGRLQSEIGQRQGVFQVAEERLRQERLAPEEMAAKINALRQETMKEILEYQNEILTQENNIAEAQNNILRLTREWNRELEKTSGSYTNIGKNAGEAVGQAFSDSMFEKGNFLENFGESFKKQMEGQWKDMFKNMISSKLEFDAFVKGNFLEDIPRMFGIGSGKITETWNSTIGELTGVNVNPEYRGGSILDMFTTSGGGAGPSVMPTDQQGIGTALTPGYGGVGTPPMGAGVNGLPASSQTTLRDQNNISELTSVLQRQIAPMGGNATTIPQGLQSLPGEGTESLPLTTQQPQGGGGGGLFSTLFGGGQDGGPGLLGKMGGNPFIGKIFGGIGSLGNKFLGTGIGQAFANSSIGGGILKFLGAGAGNTSGLLQGFGIGQKVMSGLTSLSSQGGILGSIGGVGAKIGSLLGIGGSAGNAAAAAAGAGQAMIPATQAASYGMSVAGGAMTSAIPAGAAAGTAGIAGAGSAAASTAASAAGAASSSVSAVPIVGWVIAALMSIYQIINATQVLKKMRDTPFQTEKEMQRKAMAAGPSGFLTSQFSKLPDWALAILDPSQAIMKAIGMFKPKMTEYFVGKWFGDMMGDVGLPLMTTGGRTGVNTRLFGQAGGPWEPPNAGIQAAVGDRLTNLGGIFKSTFPGGRQPGGGEFYPTQLTNAFVNNLTALGLSVEDADAYVQAAAGQFLPTFGKMPKNANAKDRLGNILMATRRNTSAPGRSKWRSMSGDYMNRGTIEYSRNVAAEAIRVFGEIPRVADEARLSTIAFADDGVLYMKRLEKALEQTKNAFAGYGTYIKDMTLGKNFFEIGQNLGQALVDGLMKQMIAELFNLESSPLGRAITAVGADLAAASTKYMTGDIAGGRAMLIAARTRAAEAQRAALETVAPWYADVQGFMASCGIGTAAPGMINQSGVGTPFYTAPTPTFSTTPGPRNRPMPMIMHGQETIRAPQQEDKLDEGIQRIHSILESGQATGNPQNITVVLQVGEEKIATKMVSLLNRQKPIKRPSPNLGVR